MQYTYWMGQREVSLTPDDDTVAFHAGRTATATLRRRLADHVAEAVPLHGEGITLLRPHEDGRDHVRSVIADHRTARLHAPVFKVGGHHLVAGDELLVRFGDGARVGPILRKAKLSTIDRLGNVYEVRHEEGRPFDIARDLLENPDVVWAEPHFMSVHHRPHLLGARSGSEGSRPDRPPAGYEIEHTRATEAWAIQAGDPEVLVAVIDEGIQKSHPSLRSIVADTYDATKDRTRQQPSRWDFHGTACAGLAVAAPGSGPIRGFGGGCGLLCAKMGYTADAGSSALVTRTLWIARALDWARRRGASVISCSWSAGAHSNAIVDMIDEARKKGRGGRGCVVVFSAGNLGDEVDFPASTPGVLTVSACNQFDEPKTGTSADGQRFWASNYGPEVDLAAPGIWISTLDLQGRRGEGAGDFINDFNGTSSSTPMVAGVVALAVSANLDLTEEELKSILRESADKVGSVPYQDGRNDQMGSGRLNAAKAVKAAKGG